MASDERNDQTPDTEDDAPVTEDRTKDDGHTGPRPRVEWTDDGGPRPEGVEAKVTDPRPASEPEPPARDDA
ncbi:hypothetical protein [Streptomyces sp. NPDC051310]|uniref:hypothetical protein n=1 Tax=Streptomyces sp. NPDC051310 TaxID=3365649 RepID=UPI003798447B